jgi:hypothetical protein
MEKLKILFRVDQLWFEVHIHFKNFVNTKFQNESSCELGNQSVLVELIADQRVLWFTVRFGKLPAHVGEPESD